MNLAIVQAIVDEELWRSGRPDEPIGWNAPRDLHSPPRADITAGPRRIVRERAGRFRSNPFPLFRMASWPGPGTSTINPKGSASKLRPLGLCQAR